MSVARAFADVNACLAQYLPDFFMLAVRRQFRFVIQIFRPQTHQVAMPGFLWLEFRQAQLLPDLLGADHKFLFGQRQGREVSFAGRVDEQ